MDAVVLVGGSGTRLRPLTLRTPKPMLPLVDRPLLAYLFDQLAAAGVTRAILACGYLPDALVAHFGAGGATASGLALEYVVESEPLGTAGAARLAASGRVSETFLLLNGDILSEHDLAALVALHRARGAAATLALVEVDDPSRYGVVEREPDGTVLRFVEKPAPGASTSKLANAGAYVLEPSVLDSIPAGRAVSIEREIFPALVGNGLAALPLDGYWSDVGTPESYLAAHVRLLEHGLGGRPGPHGVHDSAVIEDGATVHGPSFVGAGAIVREGAVVGPLATVGHGATVGARSVVERAVVQAGAQVGDGCELRDVVIGPGFELPAGTVPLAGSIHGTGADGD
jgi:mannose-1-phosphate guanylyltransferase